MGTELIKDHKDLDIYKMAFEAAMNKRRESRERGVAGGTEAFKGRLL